VIVLVIMTGLCAAGVLFLFRFLIALCQDSGPGNAVHLLRVTPAHTGGEQPDAGNTTEHSNEADHRAVRRRRASDRPAAATAPRSAIGVASSNEGAFGKVSAKAR
jgi:hypothetical protein